MITTNVSVTLPQKRDFVVILYYHWKHKLPYCPGYIASGRTVEKTVLLALVVQPSPRKRVPSGLGLARYQETSTPWRAHYNRYTDQRVRVYDVTY
jgi:hypothetical protein